MCTVVRKSGIREASVETAEQTKTKQKQCTVTINKTQTLVPCGTDGRLLLSGFQALMTLTLTLDRVTRHTVMHQSSTSIYIPNFTEIGKTFFLDRLTAGTPRSSRSRDTQSRTNIKNPTRTNLDIVL